MERGIKLKLELLIPIIVLFLFTVLITSTVHAEIINFELRETQLIWDTYLRNSTPDDNKNTDINLAIGNESLAGNSWVYIMFKAENVTNNCSGGVLEADWHTWGKQAGSPTEGIYEVNITFDGPTMTWNTGNVCKQDERFANSSSCNIIPADTVVSGGSEFENIFNATDILETQRTLGRNNISFAFKRFDNERGNFVYHSHDSADPAKYHFLNVTCETEAVDLAPPEIALPPRNLLATNSNFNSKIVVGVS
ncbi:hypothetical protein LCGC14_1797680 [marine sediment metagenome]|uniref:Uncharacterized protein n=1 Tax=marine sediment metagenome TaxID=412755 RepID=A0A0F9GQN0_9ZZZZ